MALSLSEAKDGVFVMSTPKRFLEKLGARTTFLPAGDDERKKFFVDNVSLNLDSNRVDYLFLGIKEEITHGQPNTPIEISKRKIESFLSTKSLVVIFG